MMQRATNIIQTRAVCHSNVNWCSRMSCLSQSASCTTRKVTLIRKINLSPAKVTCSSWQLTSKNVTHQSVCNSMYDLCSATHDVGMRRESCKTSKSISEMPRWYRQWLSVHPNGANKVPPHNRNTPSEVFQRWCVVSLVKYSRDGVWYP